MNKSAASPAVAIALIVMLTCGIAQAGFPTLAQRLPESTDAIIAVNIDRLLNSPHGKEAQWEQSRAANWANQPLMVPLGAKRLIMAADVKPSTMEPIWEMSLIEMDKLPTVETMAKDEGGHIDRVWDQDAVVSPINAYFLPLEGNVLATMTPAERSSFARWVRTPIKPEGNVASTYIKNVLAGLSESTDVVMAMDLEAAYGVPAIRRWLDDNDIKEIDPKLLDQVASVLGTMKGITLEITVNQKISGKAIVQFDRDAALLKDCAKPIMLKMLTYCGMRIDEIPDWTFVASGQQVTMQGDLSDRSLLRLLSIVQSPVPAATVADDASTSPNGKPADPVAASQRYFKTICTILDNAKPGASVADSAAWVRNSAKRIDQMPILHVDPALVEWGSMVSLKLKQVGATLAVGQTTITARVNGVADPSYTNSNYDTNAESINKTANDNARNQRRQAAQEQKALVQQDAMRIIEGLGDSRAKIRSDMVAKYNVEF